MIFPRRIDRTHQRELHGAEEPQRERQVDDHDDGEREQEAEEGSPPPAGEREHEAGGRRVAGRRSVRQPRRAGEALVPVVRRAAPAEPLRRRLRPRRAQRSAPVRRPMHHFARNHARRWERERKGEID